MTGDGKLVALDAKMTFDDNALYRHKDIAELRDLNEEDPLEVEASNYKLNYIKLDGNVGCMVNGAGLAMGTMDIIKLSGRLAGKFPGCRRRRFGRAGEERVQDSGERPEREGRVHQYFWRHPAMRRAGEPGVVAAAKELEYQNCRSWFAWKEPTWKKGRKFCASRDWDSRSRKE